MVGASLRHRNVVAILESGELRDGSPYLVMEHVEGIELAKMISKAPLSPAAVIDLGVQLLAAIAALYAHGIVHRDIKPQNVMIHSAIDGSVEVKLLDFGICKALRKRFAALTQDGFVLGTPHYMSPEQIRGEPLDGRSDLFAVGTVLYEAIAGAPPADGPSSDAVLTKVLVDEPTPLLEHRPDFPPLLAEIVEHALVKDRNCRWASPAAMAEALLDAARELGLPTGGDAWAQEGIACARPARRAGEVPGMRVPLRLVPQLGAPQVAARFMPTPPERPSALRASRAHPRHAPPWWPAAVALVLAGILSGLAWSNVSVASPSLDAAKEIVAR
jgi:serine/threonine-protein kinase